MWIVPGPTFATKDIVGGVEDHAGADFSRSARYVRCTGCVHCKGEGGIQFAIVYAVKRGGVDDPVWCVLPNDA